MPTRTGSTENLCILQRAPSLPRSYRQRSGIPVLSRDSMFLVITFIFVGCWIICFVCSLLSHMLVLRHVYYLEDFLHCKYLFFTYTASMLSKHQFLITSIFIINHHCFTFICINLCYYIWLSVGYQ